MNFKKGDKVSWKSLRGTSFGCVINFNPSRWKYEVACKNEVNNDTFTYWIKSEDLTKIKGETMEEEVKRLAKELEEAQATCTRIQAQLKSAKELDPESPGVFRIEDRNTGVRKVVINPGVNTRSIVLNQDGTFFSIEMVNLKKNYIVKKRLPSDEVKMFVMRNI